MNTRTTLKRRRDESSLSFSDKTDAKKSRRHNKTPLFEPHELRQALLPTLNIVLSSKLSKSFRIDALAVKGKLSNGNYTDARDYVEDVWSMFDNVWRSQPKSGHYTELADKFQLEINPVMQSLGYCCGNNYRFAPQKLCCSLKEECGITIGAHYFTYQMSHNICENCFNNAPGDTVGLVDSTSSSSRTIRIQKNKFKRVQNNVTTPEPLIDCQDCGRRQHQICALYSESIWRDGFVCDSCLTMKRARRGENPFRAKELPVTKLDSHIEARVNKFFKTNKIDDGRVHIRMLLNADQTVTVKPAMRTLFVESGELSAMFPYRSKAIFAFQEIDGVDVCFFGMYVQEYGSECPSPNTRRVYLEFLDSVNFFQPKCYRTAVYHEILLGYMDFVKQLGFAWLHIWACPPPKGENYIFFNHPPDQKIPDSLRLQRWYTTILRKGKDEQIVVDYKSILQQTRDDQVMVPTRLPYFDEDYWPYFFEETLEKIDEKSKKQRRKTKWHHCKRKSQKQNKSISTTVINRQKTGLRSKLISTMTELSNHFFSVQLHSTQSVASLPPIRDPDISMEHSIMNGPSAFFDFARDNNYEFSSPRRARFSTMCTLYELHNEERTDDFYVCNICESRTNTYYHCKVCEDYDLCVACKKTTDHAHEMHKTQRPNNQTSTNDVIQIDSDTSDDEGSTSQKDDSIQAIYRHAFNCSDSNCQSVSCQLCKRFSSHVQTCTKTDGRCRICRTLSTVMSYHSDHCWNVNCSHSFCKSAQAHTLWQQKQQRQKQHNENMLNVAAILQKTSLDIVNNGEAWTNQQFLLNLASNLTATQIQLQKMIAANYLDHGDGIRKDGTDNASTARNRGATTLSSPIEESMDLT